MAGSSSPDVRSTSSISNTLSSPGNPSHRKRGRRSTYAAASPPPSKSRFRTPESTPNSNAAATPPSTDDVEPSSETGEGYEDEDDSVNVWGTNINKKDVKAAILRFLRNFRENPQQIEGKYMRGVDNLIEIEGDSLDVDAHHVFDYDSDLYAKMVKYPREVLTWFGDVLTEMVSRINPLSEKYIQPRVPLR